MDTNKYKMYSLQTHVAIMPAIISYLSKFSMNLIVCLTKKKKINITLSRFNLKTSV